MRLTNLLLIALLAVYSISQLSAKSKETAVACNVVSIDQTVLNKIKGMF